MRPRRAISGYSAILLPFDEGGRIDWAGFEAHVVRTLDAGLVPAVDMDTGFGPLLSPQDRATALGIAGGLCAEADGPDRGFVAGAAVDDRPGEPFDEPPTGERWRRSRPPGARRVFSSHGLAAVARRGRPGGAPASRPRRSSGSWASSWAVYPAGRIWELGTFEAMLDIPGIGRCQALQPA